MLELFNKPLLGNGPFPVSDSLFDDLEITKFLSRYFREPARYLTDDTQAIRERNEICRVMSGNVILTDALRKLYSICALWLEASPVTGNDPMQMIRFMDDVRSFYDAANETCRIVDDQKLPEVFYGVSKGLKELLNENYADNFIEAWRIYAGGVEKTDSLSFDLHFSDQLTIDAISLTGVYDRRFEKNSILKSITGASRPMSVGSLLSLMQGKGSEANFFGAGRVYSSDSARQRFSQSLQQMLQSQTAAAKSQVAAMERGIAGEIREFTEHLRFALGMVEYAKNISDYSPHVCYAEIRDMDERALRVEGMVHPVLAEKTKADPNDIILENGRELILLGGLNGRGKTTYLRTAGAMQILFQMGLPLPAKKAAISPASGIFGVFTRAENTELYQGKLGKELTDLRDAMTALDDHSLFLGNEPISATSPNESWLLSREVLCMLKAKHTRGVWVSHLYKLCGDVDKLNDIDLGSRFECMRTVSGRSYAILPGRPEEYSGAREVFYSKTT